MPRHVEIFHQTLAVSTVFFNDLSLSISQGWVSPVLNTLKNSTEEFSLTVDECSWIASLEYIGKIFGAFLSAFLLDIIGRKFLLSACAFTFFISWIIILLTESVSIIYFIRIAFGVACGINDGTNSVYLGEVTSPFVRGVFGTLSTSIYYIGILFEFIIATYLPYHTTAFINAILGFMAFLSIFWMVEPAQYLLMKGKYQQAEKNYIWLKKGANDPNEVKNEFARIKQNTFAEMSKKSSYRATLTSTANYKSLSIVFFVYSLAGASGFSPIMSYASMLFPATEILTPNEFTILLGLVQLAVAISTSFFIGHFNRRTILIASFLLISLTHFALAVLYYVHEYIYQIAHFPWTIFFTVTILFSVFAFVYPAIYLLRSELFPLSIKAFGGCIAIVGYAVMSFLTTKTFLFIFHNHGIHYNFLMFSVIGLIIVLLVYWFVPETRNKSLIEIQEHLEKRN